MEKHNCTNDSRCGVCNPPAPPAPNPYETIDQLREALLAAKALLQHDEIKMMEGWGFSHGAVYSDEFQAQAKETWGKIDAALINLK